MKLPSAGAKNVFEGYMRCVAVFAGTVLIAGGGVDVLRGDHVRELRVGDIRVRHKSSYWKYV